MTTVCQRLRPSSGLQSSRVSCWGFPKNGIGDDVLMAIWKVRDPYSARLLCVVIGDTIRERRRGPVIGTMEGSRIRVGSTTTVVATMDGHHLRSGAGSEVLATIRSGEVFEGVDGPLLASFDGGNEVGMAGACFLLSLLQAYDNDEDF